MRRSPEAVVEPDGLLVDYHLDGGNGVGAITELRRRYGRDLPAILVTADRSVQVREEARAAGVQLLNKPVKPAALRALTGAMARATRRRGVAPAACPVAPLSGAN